MVTDISGAGDTMLIRWVKMDPFTGGHDCGIDMAMFFVYNILYTQIGETNGLNRASG
jgi:hypothetical protein